MSFTEYDDIKDDYYVSKYAEEYTLNGNLIVLKCIDYIEEYSISNDDYSTIDLDIKYIKEQLEIDKCYYFDIINKDNIKILYKIVDFTSINKNGDNILTYICKQNNLNNKYMIQFIIENTNVDINHINNNKRTALFEYVYSNCVNCKWHINTSFRKNVLTYLIEKSDVNIRNENNELLATMILTYNYIDVDKDYNNELVFNLTSKLNNANKHEIMLLLIKRNSKDDKLFEKLFLTTDIDIENLLNINDVELLKLKLIQEIDKNKELLKLKKFDIGTTLGNIVCKYF